MINYIKLVGISYLQGMIVVLKGSENIESISKLYCENRLGMNK